MKTNYWIEFLPSAVFGRIFILLCCINASYSQQIEKVDFINVKARVKPVFKEKKVKASASYIFKILKKCDSIYLDAPDVFLLNSIDLNSVTTKGAKFTCIVQFGGVWFAGGKFGCTWRVVQIQVIPPSTIKGFSFKKVEGDKIENGEDDIDEVTDKVDNTVLNDSDDDM